MAFSWGFLRRRGIAAMAFCFRRGLRLVIVAAITLSALVAPPAAREVAASGSGLKSRGSSNDAQGSGKLRLANTSTFQEGGVFAAASGPTSQGIDATFNIYQYGGPRPAASRSRW